MSVRRAHRWLAIFAVCGASVAVAQKTGGSIGGSDRTAPSTPSGGTRDRAPSSSPRSDPFTFPEHQFPAHRDDPPRVKSAAEIEADARWRAQHEEEARVWNEGHRDAGSFVLTAQDVARMPPPDLHLGIIRWPHLAAGLFAFALVFLIGRRASAKDRYVDDRKFVPDTSKLRLTRLSLGFDWSARRQIQAVLNQLVNASFDDAAARSTAIATLADRIAPHLQSIRYAFLEELPVPESSADYRLDVHRAQLEKKFQTRTRGEGAAAVEVHARPHEGDGLVVVSLLFTTDPSLDPLGSWSPLQRTVGWLKTFPRSHGVRIVWSPSEENDRLSSAELEVIYPELQKLSGQRLGRVACDSCKAVYAAELGQCPSCGRPQPVEAPKADAAPCPYCGVNLPASETKCDACGAFVGV